MSRSPAFHDGRSCRSSRAARAAKGPARSRHTVSQDASDRSAFQSAEVSPRAATAAFGSPSVPAQNNCEPEPKQPLIVEGEQSRKKSDVPFKKGTLLFFGRVGA